MDYAKMKDNLEYLRFYNIKDTQIMIPIIEGLIKKYSEYGVDMLQNLLLSSNSSQVKYGLAYKNFNLNEDYNLRNETTFKLTEELWVEMVAR
jgi:hypothetical protein